MVTKLTKKDVKIGTLLWYKGATTMSNWNCPAMIVWISSNGSQFRVRAFDDMHVQEQTYETDPKRDSSDSRMSMRLASIEEVREYLTTQIAKHINAVAEAEAAVRAAKAELRVFQKVRDELPHPALKEKVA